MADLFGKRIDSTYIYVLNSDPNTAIVTNGDGSSVDWDGNKIVLKTGFQDISGVKNFNSIPTVQGLEIVFKSNPLSGLGEGILEMAQNSEGSVIFAGNVNSLDGDYSVILAGNNNSLTGNYSAIGVGIYNDLIGDGSFILAGIQNSLNGNFSFIGAGVANHLTGNSSSINGGLNSKLVGNQSSILAGNNNNISGNRSFIGGGTSNSVTGRESLIGGGVLNSVDGSKSAILGGEENLIQNGDFSVIVGGDDNTLINSDNSVIVGGLQNTGSGNFSVVVGGKENEVFGELSVIIGGQSNDIRASDRSSIVAGTGNFIQDSQNSFLAGGSGNSIIESDNSFILTPASSTIDKNTDVVFTVETSDEINEGGFGANFTKFPFQDIGAVSGSDGSPAPWYTFSVEDGFERISGYWFSQEVFDAPIYASILNGLDNNVQSDFSTILNGSGNHLAGANSIVAGINNRASGHNSYILGGTGNTINLSFLTGDSTNTGFTGYGEISRNYENYNTIIGGKNNIIGLNKAAERFVVPNFVAVEANENLFERIVELIVPETEEYFELAQTGEDFELAQAGEYLQNIRSFVALGFAPGDKVDFEEFPNGVTGLLAFVDVYVEERFTTLDIEGIQNQHSHIFGGEENSADGIENFILNGKKNEIYATTHSLYLKLGFVGTFNLGRDFVFPELEGMQESDLMRDSKSERKTFENFSHIFSSVRSSTHAILSSISNSINSNISSIERGIFSDTDNVNSYPTFCNISNSLGCQISGLNYSSILNGLGNEIKDVNDREYKRAEGGNNTILNGSRNKIIPDAVNYSNDYLAPENGNYDLILNGQNNIIRDRSRQSYNTIVNGDENQIISGTNNFVVGKNNNLLEIDVTSDPVNSYFVFGDKNNVSGSANTDNAFDTQYGFIFGRNYNTILNYKPFIFGESKIDAAGISDDYEISGCSKPVLFNVFKTNVYDNDNSFLSSVDSSNVSGLDDSFVNDAINCGITSSRNCSILNSVSSTINGLDRSNISATFSTIDNSDRSNIRVNNSNIYNAEYSNIFGNSIDIGSGNYQFINIFGENIGLDENSTSSSDYQFIFGNNLVVKEGDYDFIFGLENSNSGTSYCSNFGFSNSINRSDYSQTFGRNVDISGGVDQFSQGFGNNIKINLSSHSQAFGDDLEINSSDFSKIFGRSINITGDSSFVFGQNIQLKGDRCLIFGKDIENLYNQDDCFIFGKNITSYHHGSSVIKDGSDTQSETKDDNALYLDFRNGTHINVPLWQDKFSGNNSSREGTIMYSGNYLLLFNGVEWRKVETSAI